MNKIDTHLHVMLPDKFSYPWTAHVQPLQGRFGLDDYQRSGTSIDITGALFMEVDVSLNEAAAEANYFCGLAAEPNSGIIGVIASGRPEHDSFEAHLDRIEHPKLKGVRRVLHVAPDEVSKDSLFRKNVTLLGKRGLTFDLCVRQDQLAVACELVDACPSTQFILDHCGCPNISDKDLPGWLASMAILAERPHVAVKVSGVPAYCPPGKANAATLRPWIEGTIDHFGWERCVWGSDWPVCTLNGNLSSWCNALDEILSNESTQNCQRLYSENAKKIYNLDLS